MLSNFGNATLQVAFFSFLCIGYTVPRTNLIQTELAKSSNVGTVGAQRRNITVLSQSWYHCKQSRDLIILDD